MLKKNIIITILIAAFLAASSLSAFAQGDEAGEKDGITVTEKEKGSGDSEEKAYCGKSKVAKEELDKKKQERAEGKITVREFINAIKELFKDADNEGKRDILTQIAQAKRELKNLSIGMFVRGLYVDFEKYDNVEPEIIDDRTLVPIRAVTETMGAIVEWNGKTGEITITLDDTVIMMTLESRKSTVNGIEYKLDVAPTLKNDRTLVPIRFIAEAFNLLVEWDEESKTIIIRDKDKLVPLKAVADALDARSFWKPRTEEITITRGDDVIVMKLNSREATVNGTVHTMDAAPVIYDNDLLVSIRFIADIFDVTLKWDEENGELIVVDKDYEGLVTLKALITAIDAKASYDIAAEEFTVTRGDDVVIFKIGNTEASINGNIHNMDLEPVAKGGKIFVSLQFMADAFRINLKWDEESQKVTVVEEENFEGLAPVEAIVRVVDAKYSFDPLTKEITITKDDTVIVMKLYGLRAEVNGDGHNIDIAPKVKDDICFVSIQFIADVFKLKLKWDEENQKVIALEEKIDYSVLVPLKELTKAIHAEGSFNAETDKITFTKDDIVIIMQLGKWEAKINNDVHNMGAAPLIKDETVFIPIQFIADVFNLKLEWDEETEKVAVLEDEECKELVPLKAVASAFSAEIAYNAKTYEITVNKDDMTIVMKVGSLEATVNDDSHNVGTAPVKTNGKIYVPIAFLADVFGVEARWDEESQTIIITEKE